MRFTESLYQSVNAHHAGGGFARNIGQPRGLNPSSLNNFAAMLESADDDSPGFGQNATNSGP